MSPVTEASPEIAAPPAILTGPPFWDEILFTSMESTEIKPYPSSHSIVEKFPISFAAYLSKKKLRPAVAPGRVTFSVTFPPETCARGRKFGTRDAEAASRMVETLSSFPEGVIT